MRKIDPYLIAQTSESSAKVKPQDGDRMEMVSADAEGVGLLTRSRDAAELSMVYQPYFTDTDGDWYEKLDPGILTDKLILADHLNKL